MTLADRIDAHLQAHPELSSAEEIREGVRARMSDVLRELKRDSRFYVESVSPVSGRRSYARHGAVALEGLGRPLATKRPSQCDRLIALFSDGHWHSHHELYKIGVWHSRKTDLEKRGYVFDRRTDYVNGETVYEYRLISRPLGEVEEGADENQPSARALGSDDDRSRPVDALSSTPSAVATPLLEQPIGTDSNEYRAGSRPSIKDACEQAAPAGAGAPLQLFSGEAA